MSVKVAVRVRPYNERELKQNPQCCVEMKGPTTKIKGNMGSADRTFTFDYSFWSHDGFETNDAGLSVACDGSNYADQESVYEVLGK
jgi:hypothetical protein